MPHHLLTDPRLFVLICWRSRVFQVNLRGCIGRLSHCAVAIHVDDDGRVMALAYVALRNKFQWLTLRRSVV